MEYRTDGKRRGLAPSAVILALVIALAAVTAVAAYVVVDALPAQGTQQVEIDDLCSGTISDVKIIYAGNQTGYLSTTYAIVPTYCVSENLSASSDLSAVLWLHSSDPAGAHSIQNVTISTPFSLVSISPTLPTSVAAGGNVSLNVTFQLPSIGGVYGPPSATVTAA